MLFFLNRRELAVCMDRAQLGRVTAALERSGLPFQVKVRDRSSPSAFAAGTRERSGTLGQQPGAQYFYTVYVLKKDWSAAQAALRAADR